MKKLCSVFLCLVLLCAVLPMGAVAVSAETSGTCGDNLTWDLIDGVLTVSGTGAMTEFVNEESVPWNDSRSSIKTVIIDSGVTSISYDVFQNCTELTSVTIPDSVTKIGSYAFSGCTGLTGVYITDLAAWCNITFITYASNPLYYARNLYLNGELVTDLVIPDGVTSIGRFAFDRCTGLTSVTIPESVTGIGEYAFRACTGLTEVHYNARALDNSTTSYGIFYNIGNSETGITVTFGDSVVKIPEKLFDSCTKITKVIIGSNVTSIGENAFRNCYITIYGEPGSEAERYAAANGHPFVSRPLKMKVFSVPDKVVYNVGEELNVEGLIVAVYLPGKRLEWYYDDFCDITCDDFSTPGTKTVTLTYVGVSTTFTVTVQNGVAPVPTTDDMVRLMRALLGKEAISASADYNTDGTVDVRDLVCAKKMIAGL